MSNVESPVPSAASVRPRKRGNALRLVIVGVIILAALGFLLFRGLDDATVYFKTASEAVEQRDEIGTDRFRVEGTVVAGSIKENGAITNFEIADKGVTIPVANTGQPLGIFQENIPVVLEGRFAADSDTFESDRIMVRHSNEYEEQYPDRVSGAENQ